MQANVERLAIEYAAEKMRLVAPADEVRNLLEGGLRQETRTRVKELKLGSVGGVPVPPAQEADKPGETDRERTHARLRREQGTLATLTFHLWTV